MTREEQTKLEMDCGAAMVLWNEFRERFDDYNPDRPVHVMFDVVKEEYVITATTSQGNIQLRDKMFPSLRVMTQLRLLFG